MSLYVWTYLYASLREPRRGHSRLIGHEGCSWCVLMRLLVYVERCVRLSGSVRGPCKEPEGLWEVLARPWRVLRWLLDVPWQVFGESLVWLGRDVLGRHWRVLGWFLGIPGMSLGGPWRVLGGFLGIPGRSLESSLPGRFWGARPYMLFVGVGHFLFLVGEFSFGMTQY